MCLPMVIKLSIKGCRWSIWYCGWRLGADALNFTHLLAPMLVVFDGRFNPSHGLWVSFSPGLTTQSIKTGQCEASLVQNLRQGHLQSWTGLLGSHSSLKQKDPLCFSIASPSPYPSFGLWLTYCGHIHHPWSWGWLGC